MAKRRHGFLAYKRAIRMRWMEFLRRFERERRGRRLEKAEEKAANGTEMQKGERDMTDKERMQELIEVYCDADARARADKETLAEHSPTIGRIVEVMGGAA